MTSTTDTAGHPDVAEISDLVEGLLPPSRSTDLRAHLDTCELCADVYVSLEEIRGLLGTLPGPPRMPAEVAGRIDAALAAEALLASRETPETSTDASEAVSLEAVASGASDETPADETTSGASVSPTDASEHDEPLASTPPEHAAGHDGVRVSRETSPASSRPAGRPRATTGPGRKERRSGRRRIAVLGAAFTAAALGLGSVLLSSWGGDSPTGSSGRDEQASASDTFAAGTLQHQVADLLAEKESTSTPPRTGQSFGVEGGPETDRTVPEPKVFQQPTIPDCVRQGIGRKDAALAAEQGVYQGREALLVVLPDASDTSRVTVYVVDTACVAQDSNAKAEVLLKDSYTRP
ncbi:hypothetical protein [Streptomyces sp. NPDC093094]|uniref:hypothetical protein n=1 Tax=Streptomyces sp. NPDC093094 TaxID=3366026 RepID=UPI003830C43B